MATNYPGGLDSLTNPSAGDALTSPSHSAQHANANDAIEAVQAELGTTPSGGDATVAARLTAIEAGTNLGTNSVGTAAIQDGAITAAKMQRQVGNLLSENQASVETDTTGFYVAGAATVARSTTYAAHGSACISATSTGVAPYGINVGSPGVLSSMPAVVAGETYTATAKARCSAAARVTWIRIYWRDSGGGAISNVTGQTQTVGSSGFTTFTMTAVAPSGAAYAVIEVFTSENAAGAGETLYIDALGLWRGAGGTWQLPGVPVPGQGAIKANGAVELPGGTGSPEGVVTAAPGSTWLQTDSTTDVKGWLRWIKATGTGNTGWQAGAEADTGWRDVIASIDADWTGATVYPTLQIRRIGAQVFFRGNVKRVTASGARNSFDTVYTTPTGFRGTDGNERSVGSGSNLTLSRAMLVRINYNVYGDLALYDFGGGTYAANEQIIFDGSWSTTDAWPTSLPGSAA